MNVENFNVYKGTDHRTVAAIQGKVTKQGKRNAASRLFHPRGDKDKILAWRQDLDRIVRVFNVRSGCSARHSLIVTYQTELAINTHMLVVDMHRNALGDREGTVRQHNQVSASF